MSAERQAAYATIAAATYGGALPAGHRAWLDAQSDEMVIGMADRFHPSDIEPKTEAWILESLQVNYKDELWSIRCGGACQPEYNITAHTIEQAVNELVKQVTRDAIEDEARCWQNDQAELRP
jgi:hypothetical protein